jgi:hypothetical protein
MFALNGNLTNSKDTAFRAVNEYVYRKEVVLSTNYYHDQSLARPFFRYRLGISFSQQQSATSCCLDVGHRTKSLS